MAQLSKVVSSILRDMVYAQHEANMYAMRLSKLYKQSGDGNNFMSPAPAVALGEMDLEIKYGVIDGSIDEEQSEIDFSKLHKTITVLADELAQVILGTVVSTVISSLPKKGTKGTQSLIQKLDQEQSLQQKFSTFLSHKLFKELYSNNIALVNNDGTLNQETILDIAINIGSKEVINHPDLKEYFNISSAPKCREQATDNLRVTIDGILSHLIDKTNMMQINRYQSLDIAIAADELAKLPKESIHTFRFKIAPSSLRVDNNEDNSNHYCPVKK